MDGDHGSPRLRLARLRAALNDGRLSLEAERILAARIEAAFPGATALIPDAYGFHRRAARWAVDRGATGVLFVACGLPPVEPLHSLAAAAAPDTQFAYSDPDQAVALYAEAVLAVHDPYPVAAYRAYPADPEHVAAYRADPADPAAVLGAPAAQALIEGGPVHLQVVLEAQFWQGDFAAAVVAGYARALPPGSTLALSMVTAGTAHLAWADEMSWHLEMPVHLHTPRDAEQWMTGARLRLHPWGARDARNWGAPAGVRADPEAPRVVCVVAEKPTGP